MRTGCGPLGGAGMEWTGVGTAGSARVLRDVGGWSARGAIKTKGLS